MKSDLYYLIRSFSLLSLVSSCFGVFFSFFNISFLQTFSIFFAIQIIASFFYREYLSYLNNKVNTSLYIEELNKLEKLSEFAEV